MYLPAFTQMAIAFAILLSVVIRWLRNDSSWLAIEEGRATADTLRDLTGILEYDSLQEAFGPPRLQDGVFPVTKREVLKQRTGLGYLFGDRWLDGASALIAAVTLMPIWPLWSTWQWLETLQMFAALYQVAGWVAVLRLVKKR
ncbi:MAG: hypothetical protein QM773_02305 [Hyphomonadaceae bacterium]